MKTRLEGAAQEYASAWDEWNQGIPRCEGFIAGWKACREALARDFPGLNHIRFEKFGDEEEQEK